MTEDRIRENRLRRMAARQGMVIRSSGRRDRQAWDFGLYKLYRLADPEDTSSAQTLVAERLTMDELEDKLSK